MLFLLFYMYYIIFITQQRITNVIIIARTIFLLLKYHLKKYNSEDKKTGNNI